MVDPDETLTRLQGLDDAALLEVVLAVTHGRPTLAPVHAAAAMLAAAGGHTSDVPPDPSRPAAPPDVPPPTMIGTGSPSGLDYTDAGVPTFDRVRDRIEERFGTAIGSEELERESRTGRDVDEQWQAREKAGRDRLDEIRRSMKDG
ncbi:hypothetical protein GS433_21480 [Rhodococcus hoagii]|uniref:PspA/IM30 family protein n=1 Tax=Rhodococcus hoagii TaxID=43767 RepID=UPI0007CD6930|nr:hypothetical protein [Prescottella equi]GBF13740.1 hypothetical protein Br6_01100 [Rhodococcus sp. Br-6]MBM4476425.1 hypothetical protein [Prescottella equi]MBM4536957.1 hypothetical protein [Prescottella equi]MBM4553685.1 hypothetical protein [Prescottella equi]NKR83270.1 hypothetical protein [Prescottella equi]